MLKKIGLLLWTVCSFQMLVFACSHKQADGALQSKSDTSVFEGKQLATFGNSITAAKNSWAYQVAKQLKFGNLYNGAIGGAIWSKRERTTAHGKNIVTQNYKDPDFTGISNSNTANPDDLEYQKRINNCAIVHIQKYLSINPAPAPDFIILSYGTNDLSSAAALGDVAAALQENDLDKLDVCTLAGAVKWCIKTLQQAAPRAKLYVALPIQSTSAKRNEDNLRKIAVIKKICEGTNVPYFDSFNGAGITQQNGGMYLRDGLHPNDAGNVLHANYIIKELEKANGGR